MFSKLLCVLTSRIARTKLIDLHLWGPEFGGTATTQIWVVDVYVTFGDSSSQTPQPITWKCFKESFLPTDDTDDKVCTIAVKDGIETIPWKDQDKRVVNIEQLAEEINNVINFNNFTSAQFALEAIQGVEMVKFN